MHLSPAESADIAVVFPRRTDSTAVPQGPIPAVTGLSLRPKDVGRAWKAGPSPVRRAGRA